MKVGIQVSVPLRLNIGGIFSIYFYMKEINHISIANQYKVDQLVLLKRNFLLCVGKHEVLRIWVQWAM
jgi:hypothetical protein